MVPLKSYNWGFSVCINLVSFIKIDQEFKDIFQEQGPLLSGMYAVAVIKQFLNSALFLSYSITKRALLLFFFLLTSLKYSFPASKCYFFCSKKCSKSNVSCLTPASEKSSLSVFKYLLFKDSSLYFPSLLGVPAPR